MHINKRVACIRGARNKKGRGELEVRALDFRLPLPFLAHTKQVGFEVCFCN